MKKVADTVFIIGPARLSYLTVFKTRMNTLKTPNRLEYSVVALIPKEPNEFCPNATEEVVQVRGILRKLTEEFFPQFVKDGKIKTPPKFTMPLKDGDVELNKKGESRFPGYWFIGGSCGEEYKPATIDGANKPVAGGWMSGDWGKVKFAFYKVDHTSGTIGIGVGLRGIQFTATDEHFGGGDGADGFEPDPEYKAPEGSTSSQNDGDYDPFADE